jgi:pimeloyl-ACP methyl ester carboxylesterase
MNKSTTGKSTIPFRLSGDGAHALLLVHGFLDAGSIWDSVIAGVTTTDIQKVTFDLPGMGALSADQGEISLERYAADVGAVLKQIGKRAIIVGHSMGAQIAELVGVANPDLVAGLVLLTPVPLGGVNAPAEAVQPFKNLGGQPDAQRQTRRNLSHALTPTDEDALVQLGDPVRPSVVSALVDAWNNGVAAGTQSSRFSGPVMVIRGASDPFVTEEVANAVVARFAHVRTEVVANAGHWAHVEQADAVATLIDGHVKDIGWSAAPSDGAADWKGAFAKRSATAFADAFDEDVVLEATTMFKSVGGRENVKRVLEAASKIYESLEFTNQASAGPRQYVEWKARAFSGVDLDGVTVITRNEAGAICRIAIHHRPLQSVLLFSKEMGKRLQSVVDPSHFLEATSLSQSK